MSNNNPHNSAVQEVDIGFGYVASKDYFYLRATHVYERAVLTGYLNVDQLLVLAKGLLKEGEEYKKDPIKYREKMRISEMKRQFQERYR